MFGIGGFEFALIAVVILLLFGPDKIPEIARTISKFMREFKRYQAMMESMMKVEMYNMDSSPAEDRERAAKEYRKKAGITAPGEETPGGLPADDVVASDDAAAAERASASDEDATEPSGSAGAPGDIKPDGYSAPEYADYDPELLAPELADTGWTPGASSDVEEKEAGEPS
ncbi:MAG: Sec-independent protein translocase subunit TatA/TatB [Coriobacteriia bacterium]